VWVARVPRLVDLARWLRLRAGVPASCRLYGGALTLNKDYYSKTSKLEPISLPSTCPPPPASFSGPLMSSPPSPHAGGH
jgi:hypothetical protein